MDPTHKYDNDIKIAAIKAKQIYKLADSIHTAACAINSYYQRVDYCSPTDASRLEELLDMLNEVSSEMSFNGVPDFDDYDYE